MRPVFYFGPFVEESLYYHLTNVSNLLILSISSENKNIKEVEPSELKEKIIETSLKLFDEYGYHGVSVHEIVERSGSSKGGFYHHFKSKDELLYVIHDYFISYVLQKANEAIQTCSTPTDKLHNIIQSFVKVFDLYKPHITVFYQESKYLQPQHLQAINEKRDRYRDLIFEVLEEGIVIGEFRKELSIFITGMSIIGMVNWMYKWYKAEGEKTIEEIAHLFSDLIFQSIWTEEAKHNPAYERYHVMPSTQST